MLFQMLYLDLSVGFVHVLDYFLLKKISVFLTRNLVFDHTIFGTRPDVFLTLANNYRLPSKNQWFTSVTATFVLHKWFCCFPWWYCLNTFPFRFSPKNWIIFIRFLQIKTISVIIDTRLSLRSFNDLYIHFQNTGSRKKNTFIHNLNTTVSNNRMEMNNRQYILFMVCTYK